MRVLGRGEIVVPALFDQLEEQPVLIEHREALRLGGMRGEHRLDAHALHGGEDFLLAQAGLLQARELVSPEALLGAEPFVALPAGAHGGGGVLLHHVQELEGHGVREAEPPGGLAVFLHAPEPRQMLREVFHAELLQHLGEALHQEPQIAVHHVEAFPQIVRFRRALIHNFPLGQCARCGRHGSRRKGFPRGTTGYKFCFSEIMEKGASGGAEVSLEKEAGFVAFRGQERGGKAGG